MFLTTGEINRTYTIKGIVSATVKKTLTADQLDEVDNFDDLYREVQDILIERAVAKDGEGIIAVRFEPQIVRVSVGPKYLMLHGYGTVIQFPKR
ncbi:hypothetical protein [Ligilactobacillus apodemi]|uniref:Heavy metal-binding domain-containing protein n=1 Tax=Ligilactobacillus apodemi DSM 16634 = JCM 16172 TaxID=1423724 RepID=A0A0R1TSD3_9LACO|nr:hypothetical protein [Ligilactobacillus apodemi]KRL84285.1 hypothetical protein FC32_GL001570 [Ligilactobacillus apodemi DSM 16634 = JCM 16172]MBD5069981.1 hypothetical protein [Lactobacillus sp.]MCR1902274.1 hypothetical protein [Ligilactobacillus apodemi]